MHLTVKVPLMDDRLTAKKRHQLEQLTRRDTTVIQRYLEIIQTEEAHLWQTARTHQRLDTGKLDALTVTSKPSTRCKKKKNEVGEVIGEERVYYPGRSTVPYDLKAEFHHQITARELRECRDTAVEMWHAYCEARKQHEVIYWRIMGKAKYVEREEELAQVLFWWEHERKPHSPCQAATYKPVKLPRRANFGLTAFFHETQHTKLTKYWLKLYYPGRGVYLWLPLNLSSYHQNQLAQGTLQTVQLVKHRTAHRWYAHIALKLAPKVSSNPKVNPTKKPVAVFAIDLGIEKPAVGVLLRPEGHLRGQDITFFDVPELRSQLNDLDRQVGSIQQKYAHRRNQRQPRKNVSRKLPNLRVDRKKIAIHLDHMLTAQIREVIATYAQRYTLYVALGELKGIRHSRRKGDGKSRRHRKKLHRWPFARITNFLTYKLQASGFPTKTQFQTIREAWTSKTCHKCGATDTSRPFQSLVICQACGAHLQADVNGAINIGIRLIKSLSDSIRPTFDHWLTNPHPKRMSEGSGAEAIGPSSEGASLTSSARSGDDTASAVPVVVESATTYKRPS